MAYNDFREFIDALRKKGDLIEVDRPVDLYIEVGKALKQDYAQSGPAIMFKNTGKKYPLLAGAYSTRSKALLAFEATEKDIFEKVINGLDHPIGPGIVQTAPCQEVVLTGEKIDITEFPIPTYSPKDGGPYLTAGITVTKDPETGIPNLGHYRYMVVGKQALTFFAQPFHRFGKHLSKGRKLGKTLEGAIAIGVDPILAYACQVQVSDDTNDWHVAGGLRGKPVELVTCKTVDLEVPATAEVIIEFKVDLEHKVMEGPLGEYTGYYAPASQKPTLRISAITHRNNPIFQGLLTGKPITENHILKQIPFEASFYRAMKKQFPTLEAVALPASGGVQFYTVMSMTPRYAGEARHAILAAMSSNIRPKWVIVVDPDIDVHDSTEVEWALSFRAQPAQDVVITDQLPSGPVDPSCLTKGEDAAARTMSAIGIDATRPFGKEFAEVADVPGWHEYDFPELKR
jgi:2,5-furandicarboxylate decarboxylase 1